MHTCVHAAHHVGAPQECYAQTRLDKLAKQREDTAWSPRALRINGWRYSGTLDPDLVTRAICAGASARISSRTERGGGGRGKPRESEKEEEE